MVSQGAMDHRDSTLQAFTFPWASDSPMVYHDRHHHRPLNLVDETLEAVGSA